MITLTVDNIKWISLCDSNTHNSNFMYEKTLNVQLFLKIIFFELDNPVNSAVCGSGQIRFDYFWKLFSIIVHSMSFDYSTRYHDFI